MSGHVAAEVFLLWDEWEKEVGQETPVPFWAVVWPAAILTSNYIWSHPELVTGKRILDFGCGSGLVGITAHRAGCRQAVLNDIDPVALHLASLHAQANNATVQFDSTDYLGQQKFQEPFDIIFAADLFYERATAEATLMLLRKACAAGTTVFIADAERKYAPKEGVVVLAEAQIEVNRELEGIGARNVRLLQLMP